MNEFWLGFLCGIVSAGMWWRAYQIVQEGDDET